MDMSLSKFQELVMDREAWHAAIHWSQRVRHDWATELTDWLRTRRGARCRNPCEDKPFWYQLMELIVFWKRHKLNCEMGILKERWRVLWIWLAGGASEAWATGRARQSVQSLSRVWLFVTPWTAACQASLSITNPRVYSNPCPLSQWCHPTISSSIVPFPSRLQSFPGSFLFRVFSKESVLHIRWPKDWSFSFSISPSNEYSGLISFRIDWFDLHAVQGTLKSLIQHHNSKASILSHWAFFYSPTLTSIYYYWKNHSFD